MTCLSAILIRLYVIKNFITKFSKNLSVLPKVMIWKKFKVSVLYFVFLALFFLVN